MNFSVPRLSCDQLIKMTTWPRCALWCLTAVPARAISGFGGISTMMLPAALSRLPAELKFNKVRHRLMMMIVQQSSRKWVTPPVPGRSSVFKFQRKIGNINMPMQPSMETTRNQCIVINSLYIFLFSDILFLIYW